MSKYIKEGDNLLVTEDVIDSVGNVYMKRGLILNVRYLYRSSNINEICAAIGDDDQLYKIDTISRKFLINVKEQRENKIKELID